MTPSQLKEWVAALSSDKQKDIFNAINQHASLSFNFSSKEELKLHLEIREAIVSRIIEVEKAFISGTDNNPIARYPISNEGLSFPEMYWQEIPIESYKDGRGGFMSRDNINAFDALKSLFQDGKESGQNPSNLVIDCNRMSVVIAYVALLDVVKSDVIKKMFPLNRKILIGTWHELYGRYGKVSLLAYKYFKEEKTYTSSFTKSSIDLCLPGDIVYFRNDLAYKSLLDEIRIYLSNDGNSAKERNELLEDSRLSFAWTGEYCICTGKNKFSGFGLREGNTIEFSSDHIRKTLLKASTNLYELVKDKAKPIRDKINRLKIPPPSLDNVILYDLCYRVNTDEIMKKM
jgi:Protein-glutamine gamma-glutamyltransferase